MLLVRGHAQRALGVAPAVIGWAAWMESAILTVAGVPTVVGPGGDGAHAVVESDDLASVERCADVLLAAAREFARDGVRDRSPRSRGGIR